MPKDVEFNYTASDRTGPANDSVRRRLKKTGDDAKSEVDKLSNGILKSVLQSVEKVAPNLSKNVASVFGDAGELAGPALAIGIAASAPAIGAVISGAIIGGAGLGGIAGGLLLSKSDPKVTAALGAFTQGLQTRLKGAAQPFVGVWLDGIKRIGGALNGIDFEGVFSDAAKQAGPLISGVARAVSSLGKGIADLIHNAGPAVKAIGDGVGDIGTAIGQGLESLADNGKEGADALSNLFALITAGTSSVFALVDGLTETYGFFRKFAGPGVADAVRAVQGIGKSGQLTAVQLHGAASATDDATTSVDQYGHAILTTGSAITSFTEKVDNLAAAGHSLYDSTTSVGEATDNLKKALKENGKTLDENTEKGRNNRTALSNLATALVAQYNATVQVNGEGVKSNGVAATNRAAFIKLATQLGLSKTAAANLATELGLIPAKKNTDFTANTHDAEARAEALKEKINNIRGKTVTVTVAYAYTTFGKPRTSIAPGDFFGFDANQSFTFAGAGSGVSRVGGPTPVNVTSDVNSYLYLDGSLVYSNTARQVRDRSRRDAWRQKVGRK